MNFMRLAYRVRQFWYALFARPTPEDLALARSALTASQMRLFERLQPSEQVHSLTIYRQLLLQGDTQPDLLVAALLHDVGKSRYPLHPWDRALIVLARAIVPERVKDWGRGQPRGWQRAFVVAQQHPDWGAEMAAQAGVSPLAVNIIQHHQDFSQTPGSMQPTNLTEDLLVRLKNLDEDN
jgi:putative nucleotidyltransferase with HDIG domain